jgi:hypothetical protein
MISNDTLQKNRSFLSDKLFSCDKLPQNFIKDQLSLLSDTQEGIDIVYNVNPNSRWKYGGPEGTNLIFRRVASRVSNVFPSDIWIPIL